jgi:cytochrome c nitrite reductase small subunit
LAVLAGLLAGVPAGLGGFTFVFARGHSYLTDDPAACANCHVMQAHYDAWLGSSHGKVAVCNDCHTPKSPIPKYFTKALNGYHHSKAFTLGGFHEPIQITARNESITEDACRRCHADIVRMIDRGGYAERVSCLRCHENVGHLE